MAEERILCSVCKHDSFQCFEDYIGADGEVYNECTNCGAKPARQITVDESGIIIEEAEQIFDGESYSK